MAGEDQFVFRLIFNKSKRIDGQKLNGGACTLPSKSTCTRTIYGTSTRGLETVPDGAGRIASELIAKNSRRLRRPVAGPRENS